MGNSLLELAVMETVINIIHDDRQIERLDPLLATLRNQTKQINYRIWSPVWDSKSVVRSINLSHKQIVQTAKELKRKEICIAENDLLFTSHYGWDYFLFNKPKEYDLYLSATYMPISSRQVCGFHLYFISEKFYDRFLDIPEDVHIDTYMNELRGDYHFCYPFPALQRAGFSLNNCAYADYNSVLTKEDIYQ
jgi:hypothetical protein